MPADNSKHSFSSEIFEKLTPSKSVVKNLTIKQKRSTFNVLVGLVTRVTENLFITFVKQLQPF